MSMAAACLEWRGASERFDARTCLPASGCALSCCPAIRSGEFFPSGKAENYIAIELRKPLEACAMIWPVVEPEAAPVPQIHGVRRIFAGGFLSVVLHISMTALAIGFLPAATELPAGSEIATPVEILDEATFAALFEGTAKGQDFPAVPLPEPLEPEVIRQALASEAAMVAAPDPDVPMPEAVLPVNTALLLPAETGAKTEAEKQPPPVQTKALPPLKQKPRKALQAKGTQTGAKASGREGAGRDAVSTASSIRGRGSSREGMAGAAADAGLRSRIIAHLGRHKRYPDAALSMRLEGSVGVTFSVGADGSLKSAAVNISSGHSLLDREVIAMLRRAQPFPVSSAGGGQGITVTTRIGYIYPH